MRVTSNSRSYSSSQSFWLFLALIISWLVCFPGFIGPGIQLSSDALSYYYMANVLTSNLSAGSWPMLLPEGNNFVPFDFFARRLGAYNPFYLVLLVLDSFLTFTKAYSIFLFLYFLFGMAGFYRLAKVLTHDRMVAFLAVVFLMFSSWATRLFDSYLHLVFVPLIWFFVFLLSFARKPRAHKLLGAAFFQMILSSTYIPFYYLLITAIVLSFGGLFFPESFREAWRRSWKFFTQRKMLSSVCLAAVLVSFLPGALFFQSGQKSVYLAERSAHVKETEAGEPLGALKVGFKTVHQWGIEEDIGYSLVFSDMRYFIFAVVFLPLTAVCLFLMGLFGRRSRTGTYLLVITFFALVFLSHRMPLYRFLYDHVPVFQYFRNLHFFLWFLILPAFILLIAEQLRSVLAVRFETANRRKAAVGLVVLIHAAYLAFLLSRGHVIAANWAILGASTVFFTWLVLSGKTINELRRPFVWGVLALSFLQAFEVYGYLHKNRDCKFAKVTHEGAYAAAVDFEVPSRKKIAEVMADRNSEASAEAPYVYFQPMRKHDLSDKMGATRNRIESLPFVAYTAVEQEPAEKHPEDYDRVFNRIEGPAWVGHLRDDDRARSAKVTAQVIVPSKESGEIEKLRSDQNGFEVKTRFEQPVFLVYTDYNDNWSAWVDGQPARVRKANSVFNGVWLDAGEHTLKLRYGKTWAYVFNIVILAVFYIFGIFTLVFSVKRALKARAK